MVDLKQPNTTAITVWNLDKKKKEDFKKTCKQMGMSMRVAFEILMDLFVDHYKGKTTDQIRKDMMKDMLPNKKE